MYKPGTSAGHLKAATVFSKLTSSCLLVAALFVMHSAFQTCRVQAQEVVDRMVATVNSGVRSEPDLITYTDLLWQMALQPNTPIERPSSQNLNRALRLLIDQRLILQEAAKLPTITPTAEEIKNARDELVKAFATPAEFQERLRRVGLTSEKLDEILDQRLKIEKYLDFRFRNFVVITQSEIADYYEAVYVPRLRARSPGQIVPTIEESQDEIERILTEAKIESDMDAFLDNARERAEIVVLHSV
ncbi:MAG TPA: hypothetical protein VMM84_10110 [Pyrinomonadaceae bacterium]|nr:hypothetical protein [Pyrinomonadaceae bacterium]